MMRTALLLAVVALTGCSREDGERLGRVGRLAAEKVRDAAPARTPLGDLHPEATPAGRVRARIRMDATLADQPIQVSEGPEGLHLRGRVARPEQAEWAVKLATETSGVPAIINELTVGQ
jgi:osmotically-inducible protein OsmY